MTIERCVTGSCVTRVNWRTLSTMRVPDTPRVRSNALPQLNANMLVKHIKYNNGCYAEYLQETHFF